MLGKTKPQIRQISVSLLKVREALGNLSLLADFLLGPLHNNGKEQLLMVSFAPGCDNPIQGRRRQGGGK